MVNSTKDIKNRTEKTEQRNSVIVAVRKAKRKIWEESE